MSHSALEEKGREPKLSSPMLATIRAVMWNRTPASGELPAVNFLNLPQSLEQIQRSSLLWANLVENPLA